jgi:molybdopterin converting factor small subunit
MKISVKIIGHLIYDAGFSEKEFEFSNPPTADQLLSLIHIKKNYPKIIVRNAKAITPEETLEDGDRVVISPIYSGG